MIFQLLAKASYVMGTETEIDIIEDSIGDINNVPLANPVLIEPQPKENMLHIHTIPGLQVIFLILALLGISTAAQIYASKSKKSSDTIHVSRSTFAFVAGVVWATVYWGLNTIASENFLAIVNSYSPHMFRSSFPPQVLYNLIIPPIVLSAAVNSLSFSKINLKRKSEMGIYISFLGIIGPILSCLIIYWSINSIGSTIGSWKGFRGSTVDIVQAAFALSICLCSTDTAMVESSIRLLPKVIIPAKNIKTDKGNNDSDDKSSVTQKLVSFREVDNGTDMDSYQLSAYTQDILLVESGLNDAIAVVLLTLLYKKNNLDTYWMDIPSVLLASTVPPLLSIYILKQYKDISRDNVYSLGVVLILSILTFIGSELMNGSGIMALFIAGLAYEDLISSKVYTTLSLGLECASGFSEIFLFLYLGSASVSFAGKPDSWSHVIPLSVIAAIAIALGRLILAFMLYGLSESMRFIVTDHEGLRYSDIAATILTGYRGTLTLAIALGVDMGQSEDAKYNRAVIIQSCLVVVSVCVASSLWFNVAYRRICDFLNSSTIKSGYIELPVMN